tara:strand:+ start:490 stop:771 length:282 start_codon:yes stop_codon:yes gene_type:complete
MSSRKNVEKEIEMRLINYRLAIARLREKGTEASDEARATIERKLVELNEMEAKAETRLNELREASDDSWDSIKQEVEKYWDSLGRELKAYDPT